MAPKHHEAYGERHGEQQAERPPQPGPEHGREDHGDGRKTGAVAVDERLNHLPHDQLRAEEQAAGQQHRRPPGIDHGAQQNWRGCGDERADIRNEAHQHGEDAPHHGARNADRPKPERDENAIG